MQFSVCLSAFLSVTLFLSPVISFPTLSSRATTNSTSKRIIYYQDAGLPTKQSSLLPLINSTSKPIVDTVILSTFINYEDGFAIYTNETYIPLNDTRFDNLWSDVKQLQAHGIKVVPMLLGNWRVLEQNQTYMESNYKFLREGLKQYNFDGIDLDIEDALNNDGTPPPIGLNETVRLIDHIRKHFGPDFQITMSPVASCLGDCGASCASGFSYKQLEQQRGDDISWYNAQFYDGFGDASNPKCYEAIMKEGWKQEKVIMGLSTNFANTRISGGGYVDINKLKGVIESLVKEFPTFGGVAGWEYFDAEPGSWPKPWKWSEIMAGYMGLSNGTASVSKRASSFAS